MEKLLLIGNDTLYRRYLIASLLEKKFDLVGCVFETKQIKPTFNAESPFAESERIFMEKNYKNIEHSINSIPTWYVGDANQAEAHQIIKKIEPKYVLISGAGKIDKITQSLFSKPAINVHLGITEEYRGLDTNLWAIYHKDWSNIGVTLHLIDNTLDTGNILCQERLKLQSNMKISELRYHEFELATKMVIDTLRKYMNSEIVAYEQKKKGRYYSFMPFQLKEIVERNFNLHCEKI